MRAHRGLAVSARAEPRTTRDVDLAVSTPNDEAAEQLIWHLQGSGYAVRILLEQERTGRIATVRLVRETERSVFVDLLFTSSGIEAEIVDSAEELELLDGLNLAVTTRAHLIALKVLARDDRNRPHDWDDLRALLADASRADLDEARIALGLIEHRGFNAVEISPQRCLERLQSSLHERSECTRRDLSRRRRPGGGAGLSAYEA